MSMKIDFSKNYIYKQSQDWIKQTQKAYKWKVTLNLNNKEPFMALDRDSYL